MGSSYLRNNFTNCQKKRKPQGTTVSLFVNNYYKLVMFKSLDSKFPEEKNRTED